MSAHHVDRKAHAAAVRRRLLDDIKVADQTIVRATAARDALIRKAVAARIPRQDIMAATGLSRSRIYQIATGGDTPANVA